MAPQREPQSLRSIIPQTHDLLAGTSPPTATPPAKNKKESRLPYLNNATLIVPLTITAHMNTTDTQSKKSRLNQEVFQVLQEIVPEFLTEECSPQDLIVRNLTGGLSNYLLTVSLPAIAGDNRNHDNTLLIRLHTSSAEEETETEAEAEASPNLLDRTLENKISAELSQAGMAPRYHGRFVNGRIEQFYEGVRTVTCHEMADKRYARAIAVHLARLHQMEISCLNEKHDNGNDNDNDNGGDGIGIIGKGKGQIWERIEDWIRMAKDAWSKGEDYDKNETKQQKERELVEEMLVEIHSEWKWLKSELLHVDSKRSTSPHSTRTEVDRAIDFGREVVFTHMDCQSLNILTPVQDEEVDSDHGVVIKDESMADIRLIDFEYADMNPRAADLANTFAEFCDMNNLIPDYKNQYPAASVQDVFLLAYIREYDDALANELEGMNKDAVDAFLSTMRDEIGKYSLLSHLCWASWALLQSSASSIEFDYITYATIRLEGFRFFKTRHWPELN